jgi:hypothetical protein
MEANSEWLNDGSLAVGDSVGDAVEGVLRHLDALSEGAICVQADRAANHADVVLAAKAPKAMSAANAGITAHPVPYRDPMDISGDRYDSPGVLVAERERRNAPCQGVWPTCRYYVRTVAVFSNVRRTDACKHDVDYRVPRLRMVRLGDRFDVHFTSAMPHCRLH